ncbi:MAG: hypothetical protein ACTSUY_11975, partial [Alphaproteobacteria bacterium]
MNAKILIGAAVAAALVAVVATGGAQAHKKSTSQMNTEAMAMKKKMADDKMMADKMAKKKMAEDKMMA